MSGLVGNPEARFPHFMAHFLMICFDFVDKQMFNCFIKLFGSVHTDVYVCTIYVDVLVPFT